MVEAEQTEAASNADQYALEATELLKQAFQFVYEYSGHVNSRTRNTEPASQPPATVNSSTPAEVTSVGIASVLLSRRIVITDKMAAIGHVNRRRVFRLSRVTVVNVRRKIVVPGMRHVRA